MNQELSLIYFLIPLVLYIITLLVIELSEYKRRKNDKVYEAHMINKIKSLDEYDRGRFIRNSWLTWVRYVAANKDGLLFAFNIKPIKSLKDKRWSKEDFSVSSLIRPEQVIALCGRLPEWDDEEPTPVKK